MAALFRNELRERRFYTADVADRVRRQLERVWPRRRWNVVVESEARANYFVANEQLNLGVGIATAAIFDRTCEVDEPSTNASTANVTMSLRVT